MSVVSASAAKSVPTCQALAVNTPPQPASAAAIVGSIIYKACVALALSLGLVPQDLKLVPAVLFLLILVLGGARRKKVKFNA